MPLTPVRARFLHGLRSRIAAYRKRRRSQQSLYGAPVAAFTLPYWALRDRLRLGQLGSFVTHARRIPSWTRGVEAEMLAMVAHTLPPNAVIVEIGSFLGASAVLMAGARKLRGSGVVHAVDPFDGSGDQFSRPIYSALTRQLPMTQLQQFMHYAQRARVAEWIVTHQGTARTIAECWSSPIDMLFLDGDQSYEGVREAFDCWEPFLKLGGVAAFHNSQQRVYEPEHDGHWRLRQEVMRPPRYTTGWCVSTMTFAQKLEG